MNFIALDTETGGTRPGKHALLSIAAYPSWDIANPFIAHIRHEDAYTIEPDAAEINGYTPELWEQRGAVWIFDAMADLGDWLSDRFRERRALMLAHNAGFDRMFLDEASHFTGMKMPIRHAWRCSMDKMGTLMDRGLIPQGKTNLNRLGELSGQWHEGGRPAIHEAGADALACLRGYIWLLGKEKAEIDTLRQLYTDSLSKRRQLEGALQRIYDATEGGADGAPDASSYGLLCNEVSGLARPFLTDGKEGN